MISFNHEFCNIYVITRYTYPFVYCNMHSCMHMKRFIGLGCCTKLHIQRIAGVQYIHAEHYDAETLCYYDVQQKSHIRLELGVCWLCECAHLSRNMQSTKFQCSSSQLIFLNGKKSRGKISKINYTLASHKENCRCRPMSSFFLPPLYSHRMVLYYCRSHITQKKNSSSKLTTFQLL